MTENQAKSAFLLEPQPESAFCLIKSIGMSCGGKPQIFKNTKSKGDFGFMVLSIALFFNPFY